MTVWSNSILIAQTPIQIADNTGEGPMTVYIGPISTLAENLFIGPDDTTGDTSGMLASMLDTEGGTPNAVKVVIQPGDQLWMVATAGNNTIWVMRLS